MSGTMRLVPVAALPVPRPGFVDCAELVDGGVGAVRLNTECEEELYRSCPGCRHLLMHHCGRGWHLKGNSREDVAERREEARDKQRVKIGPAWRALKKMRKQAA